MSLHFEWDINKATVNIAKHGVSFEEAATVFRNPIAAIFDDVAHFSATPTVTELWSLPGGERKQVNIQFI